MQDQRRILDETRLNRALTQLQQVIGRDRDMEGAQGHALGVLEALDGRRLRELIQILASGESDKNKVIGIKERLPYFFNPIKVRIDAIDPTTAWPGKQVTVTYTVTNRSSQPTSGAVTAVIWDGILRRVAHSPWLTSKIDSLQPGASATYDAVIHAWDPGSPLVPGNYTAEGQYWVEDEHGSITFINRDPLTGEQHPTTYGLAAAADDNIELYPTCTPDGPDFLRIKSFGFDPPMIESDASGMRAAFGSKVSIKWQVESGGFPAEGVHPGSVSSVKLVGGFSGDPNHSIDVASVDQLTESVSGVLATDLVRPWTLVAMGNCGTVQQTAALQFRLAPPKIVTFQAQPNYINLGDSAQLQWSVECPGHCSISFQGHIGFNEVVLDVPTLPIKGQMKVQPQWDTTYKLTATNESGSVSGSFLLKLYNPASAQNCPGVFYLKLTNPDPTAVRPCFTLAICAQSEDHAKQLAESQNSPYKAMVIKGAEFTTACQ